LGIGPAITNAMNDFLLQMHGSTRTALEQQRWNEPEGVLRESPALGTKPCKIQPNCARG
jgi:hypothetical protein